MEADNIGEVAGDITDHLCDQRESIDSGVEKNGSK